MTGPIPNYAVGYPRTVDFDEDVIRCMRGIDDTLTPFGGGVTMHGRG